MLCKWLNRTGSIADSIHFISCFFWSYCVYIQFAETTFTAGEIVTSTKSVQHEIDDSISGIVCDGCKKEDVLNSDVDIESISLSSKVRMKVCKT